LILKKQAEALFGLPPVGFGQKNRDFAFFCSMQFVQSDKNKKSRKKH